MKCPQPNLLFSLHAVSNKNCLLSGCPFPGTNNLAALLIPICWLSVRAGMERQQAPKYTIQSLSNVVSHLKLNRTHTHTHIWDKPIKKTIIWSFVFVYTQRTYCMCALVSIMCAFCGVCALTETLKRSTLLYSIRPQRQEHAFELALSAAQPSIMMTGTQALRVWHQRSTSSGGVSLCWYKLKPVMCVYEPMAQC